MAAIIGNSISLATTASKRSTALQTHYRPDIDGLRAVAILSVLSFHVAPKLLPGGFVGVDIFFVISGYLISGIIFRDLQRGEFNLAKFYARRIRRIFPALIVMVPVVLVLAWPVLVWDEYQALGKQILAGTAFVSNLVFYNDSNSYFYNPTRAPLLHLWSLGVEEQFYLVWPLFLLVIWRTRRGLLTSISAATIISFGLNIVALSYDPLASFYLPSSRLWELSLGALLAYGTFRRPVITDITRTAPPSMPTRPPLSAHWSGISGAALLAASLLALNSSLHVPGWWALIPCVGTVLLIYAGPTSWINSKVLASRPMVFIGLISYPLYIWHWPLIALTRTYEGSDITWPALSLLAVGCAIVLAVLTWKYVEIPIRSSQDGFRNPLILFTVMAACGGVGCLAFLQVITARPSSAEVSRFVEATRTDWLPGTNVAWTYEPNGLLELGSGSKRTLFFGDSHVQQIYPRILQLVSGHLTGARKAVFAVRAACAPFAVERLANSTWKTRCQQLIHRALEYAKDPLVDTVVIGANWPFYLTDHGPQLARHPTDPDVVLENLRSFISDLRAQNKRVYVVLNMPMSPEFDPRQMIQRNLVAPAFSVKDNTEARAQLEENIGPSTSRVRRIARDSGAIVVDEMAWLCTKSTCPAVTPAGVPIYHDSGHLNPVYARESAGYLDETMLDRDDSATAQMTVEKLDRDIISLTRLR